MGEIADELIAQGFEQQDEDASYYGDESGYGRTTCARTRSKDYPYHITCKFCGHGKLKWVLARFGWILVSRDGQRHSCLKGKYKTCRVCGTRNLLWGKKTGDWRLYGKEGELHLCVPTLYGGEANG